MSMGGAASAPAPAREPQSPKVPEPVPSTHIESVPEKSAEASSSGSVVGSAPTFTFGGTASESTSSGGNKKIVIGIAAALVIAAAGYFGWSHFKSNGSENTASPAPVSQSAPASQPAAAPLQTAKPAAAQVTPAPGISSAPVETESPATRANDDSEEPTSAKTSSHPTAPATAAKPAKQPASTAKTEEEEQPEPAPLMVKQGKAPTTEKPAPSDAAPAPSMIGMAAPASVPPPDLVSASSTGVKPVLQTLNISQGVSTGLLYKKVAPVYPPAAVRMRVEGTVELMATISKSGDITQVKVLSGDKQLSGAAVAAVKQWKYKPYLLNGEPVEIQTQVTVNFKLPN
jgi:periplasmic protein TonB